MFEPVKRSEALAPLSRDHHRGLFVALQLKRAASDTRQEARAAFLDFFTVEGGTALPRQGGAAAPGLGAPRRPRRAGGRAGSGRTRRSAPARAGPRPKRATEPRRATRARRAARASYPPRGARAVPDDRERAARRGARAPRGRTRTGPDATGLTFLRYLHLLAMGSSSAVRCSSWRDAGPSWRCRPRTAARHRSTLRRGHARGDRGPARDRDPACVPFPAV